MKKSGECGFTLVELVMAMAVAGLIISFLGSSIYQMLTVTRYGNDRLTAMHELQNAAYWFNLDGQKAVSAAVDDDLILVISAETTITYSLEGTELRRSLNDNQMVLARHITGTDFSIQNRVITMSLVSAPDGRDNVVESGTYQVHLRPVEGGG